MRFDINQLEEILSTVSRNKLRSVLTAFGVFWGIFMLVILNGGGLGFMQMMTANFEGFTTNSGFIMSSSTELAYKGFQKGRVWSLDSGDPVAVKQSVDGVDVVAPIVFTFGATAVYGEQSASCSMKGITPDYGAIEEQNLAFGRALNAMDIAEERKVCIIGSRLRESLFPGIENPCGMAVKVDGIYYRIIGVYAKGSGNMSIGSNTEETVVVPIKLMQSIYNRGNNVDMISFKAKPGYSISELEKQVTPIIKKRHFISPDDRQAVIFFNSEAMFSMIDSLFKGINILTWMIGLGTLLAGAIGVSNIMMVTVRERTSEIGIRRAIGAKPVDIMMQILMESVLITIVAGLSGITLGVMVLSALEYGVNMADGTDYSFLIPFSEAVGALLILVVFGALAGMAPAYRAMSIKPIDAMRDE